MEYDRGDILPFDFELNRNPFGLKSKGKLPPRLFPIQYERKWKHSFLSVGVLYKLLKRFDLIAYVGSYLCNRVFFCTGIVYSFLFREWNLIYESLLHIYSCIINIETYICIYNYNRPNPIILHSDYLLG